MSSRKGKVVKANEGRRRDVSMSSEDDRNRRDNTRGNRPTKEEDKMPIDEDEEDPGDFRREERRTTGRAERGDERRETFSRDDKANRARDDFRRDFRERLREDPKDESRRGDRDERRDDFRKNREGIREKTREPQDRRDAGGKNLVTAYVPCAGIDEQVIVEDIEIYLGPSATVRRGRHPDDDRVEVYHMKGTYTLTQSMIEDLKMDTIRWKEEQRRRSRQIPYASSDTHKNRQDGGESRPLPRAIPASRFTDPSDRLGSEMSSSPRERMQRDHRSTRDARDSHDSRDPRDTRDTRDSRDSRNNRDSRDTRDAREKQDRKITRAPEDESRFMTEKEVRLLIPQMLKDQGKSSVSKVQFERLTAEYMEHNNPKPGPARPRPDPGQPPKPIGRPIGQSKPKEPDEENRFGFKK